MQGTKSRCKRRLTVCTFRLLFDIQGKTEIPTVYTSYCACKTSPITNNGTGYAKKKITIIPPIHKVQSASTGLLAGEPIEMICSSSPFNTKLSNERATGSHPGCMVTSRGGGGVAVVWLPLTRDPLWPWAWLVVDYKQVEQETRTNKTAENL